MRVVCACAQRHAPSDSVRFARTQDIVAGAAIIAINIFNRDSNNEAFFTVGASGNLKLNTDIWNNETMTTVTGYSIAVLRECLFDLATFMSQNLTPNRLKGIDLEAIRLLEPYNQIPQQLGLALVNTA